MSARLFVLFAVLLCLTPVSTFAQARPAPLQGVEAVTVKVSIVAPPNTSPALLTESRLQTLAELKLRAWALRVVSEEDPIPGIRPVVELEVTLLETRAAEKLAGYAFVTRLVVKEPGRSLRNGAPVFSELWSHSFLNVSDPKSVIGDMERSTGELVDQFINEWLRTRQRVTPAVSTPAEPADVASITSPPVSRRLATKDTKSQPQRTQRSQRVFFVLLRVLRG